MWPFKKRKKDLITLYIEESNKAYYESRKGNEHVIAPSWHSLFVSTDGSVVLQERGPFTPWGMIELSPGDWAWLLFAVGDTGKVLQHEETGEPKMLLALVNILAVLLPIYSQYLGPVLDLKDLVQREVLLTENQKDAIHDWFKSKGSQWWGPHWRRRTKKVQKIVG